MDDIVERYEIEVKRGMMQVAILCLLERESYGYDIIKSLKEDGLGVEDGTLYPILARLEGEKLLSSKWKMNGPRPRKYYVITAYGNRFGAEAARVVEKLHSGDRANGRKGERRALMYDRLIDRIPGKSDQEHGPQAEKRSGERAADAYHGQRRRPGRGKKYDDR